MRQMKSILDSVNRYTNVLKKWFIIWSVTMILVATLSVVLTFKTSEWTGIELFNLPYLVVYSEVALGIIVYAIVANKKIGATDKKKRQFNLMGSMLALVVFGLLLLYEFNLIVVADIIEIIVLIGLVGVTAEYVLNTEDIAKATSEQATEIHKQATASERMAKVMEKQRYDALRPVIDIVDDFISLDAPDKQNLGFDIKNSGLSKGLPCKLCNVGVGPAMEVYTFIVDAIGKPLRLDIGVIPRAIGEEEMGYERVRLYLQKRGDYDALVVYYKDVFGNAFESSRQITLFEEKSDYDLSPLKISPLSK